ncbi:hypothetical protein E1301_Tti019725 [Triplophysa tibetana]|uniref:Uncharacterized protein n=1 Tax=Triplophysa tibetana TaxID=1572043 RepID=A0A5A9NAW4_9TELE|nr:hypothetical protein E1301_Tti019725 [Triplophysa tibetana]
MNVQESSSHYGPAHNIIHQTETDNERGGVKLSKLRADLLFFGAESQSLAPLGRSHPLSFGLPSRAAAGRPQCLSAGEELCVAFVACLSACDAFGHKREFETRKKPNGDKSLGEGNRRPTASGDLPDEVVRAYEKTRSDGQTMVRRVNATMMSEKSGGQLCQQHLKARGVCLVNAFTSGLL